MNGILSDETIFVRSEGRLSATVGDQAVLMSVQRGKYVGHDPVGSEIRNRIEKPVSVEALAKT